MRSLFALLGALSLLLAGCGGSDGDSGDPSAPAPASESEQAQEDASPDENGLDDDESGADASEEVPEEDAGDDAAEGDDPSSSDSNESAPEILPTKVVEAGKVSQGTTRSASGKNDALVTFTQSEAFAVVAQFECKECKGDIEIKQLGSHDVLDTANKSLKGAYLLDIIGSTDEEQTLIVRADGKWDVKLLSWNDLPISTGNLEGKGADVVYMGDEASGIEVDYKPPKGGGKLSVTATSAVEKDGDTPKVVSISGGKKFTKKKDIKLPGVITISGKGSWTIKLLN